MGPARVGRPALPAGAREEEQALLVEAAVAPLPPPPKKRRATEVTLDFGGGGTTGFCSGGGGGGGGARDSASCAGDLAAAAAEVGLDSEAALAYAQDDKNKARVVEEARQNSMSGVSGVPFFRINGEDAFSGAQPPEAIREMIEQAAA